MPGAQQAQSPRPPPRSHTRQSSLPGAGSPGHGGGGGVDQGDPGGPLSGDPLTPRVPQLPLTQVHEEQVVELGGGCGEVDLVGEDAHPLLKHKDDICTQRVLQEVGGALLTAGGGVGHHNEQGRRPGGQERCLQQGPLHMEEVGLPELQVPAGDKRCLDGVVEDILDTELRPHSSRSRGYPAPWSPLGPSLGEGSHWASWAWHVQEGKPNSCRWWRAGGQGDAFPRSCVFFS